MTRALSSALLRACALHGPSIALSGSGQSITFDAFADAARSVERALRSGGLRPDEPVVLDVSNDPRDLVALLGIWLADGVAIPVHRNTPAAISQRLIDRTQARFRVQAAESPSVLKIAVEAPPIRPLLEDAAFVIFTSGSTGEPKGVVMGQQAFHDKLQQIDGLLDFGPGERTLLVLNITFSFGLWVSLLTLLRGGTLFMHEKFDPRAFCDTLVDQRITRVGMVPTMMRVLFADPALASPIDRVVACGCLAQILIGGESLGRSLADTIRARFETTRLVDIYGLTETATCDFFAFPADYAAHPGCIGRPAPGIAYRIANDDRAATDGDVGELQIATPYAMRGYLDAPDLTAGAFSGRWFRTGDLARVVDGGLVELMGRRKEVISRGGNKVTPVEIEQALCAHPDVAAAMAVGVVDPLLGERIHMLLVPRSGTTLDLAAIQDFLATRLERYKHPDRYYLADALPTGRTGKADRGQLRTMIADRLVAPLEPRHSESTP